MDEQPEYTGEEDAEPYFYPSWERDGCRFWPVMVRCRSSVYSLTVCVGRPHTLLAAVSSVNA